MRKNNSKLASPKADEQRSENDGVNGKLPDQYRLKVKKYLELENVSVLAGAGTSFHLGAPVIRTIDDELKQQYANEISKYFKEEDNPSLEDLINCLQADRYMRYKKGECINEINMSIAKIQKLLFEKCNTQETNIHNSYKNDTKLINNRYHYHEMFIKKLLQRPINLKRANLFTTNYDLAFDYALDNLGVHYINGFMGVHNRYFRPELYEYDLFYPGDSVAGKVHRAEKVLKYFKIHGSLSWLYTEPTTSNIYGIKEISLNDKFHPGENEEVMIYPCVSKKSFTLDLPYSELFRQFSQAINQPQAVLFCIGYSFNDEHINDIIKQALSIPSFTLIIANYTPDDENTENPENHNNKNLEIERLKALDDKRIIILEQSNENTSTFRGFVENVMPDLYEEEEMEFIAETMKKLYTINQKNDAANTEAQGNEPF
jgi:hypothetical protein